MPGSPEWPRVEDVLALHDHEFNDMWLHSWTRRQIGFGIGRGELDKIKDQVHTVIHASFQSGNSWSFRSTVWRSYRALFRLPFFVRFVLGIYRGPWNRILPPANAIFLNLLDTPCALVYVLRRILAHQRAHIFCAVGHSRVFSCRATSCSVQGCRRKGSRIPMVEAGYEDFRKPTRHTFICWSACSILDSELPSRGICDATVYRTGTIDYCELSMDY